MLRNPNNLSYRNVILSEAAHGGLPVAYWPLDEANGTAVADMMAIAKGTSRVGTIGGGVALGAIGPISREPSRAMTLNGSTGKIDLPNLVSGTGNLTIEAWVKTASATEQWILSQRDASGSGFAGAFLLRITSGGLLNFFATDLGGSVTTNSTNTVPVADGKWRHVGVSYSGTSGSFYVDGVRESQLFGSQSLSGTPASAIGYNRRDGGTFLAGSLCHVALYNYALAADRIKYHYLAGLNGINGGK